MSIGETRSHPARHRSISAIQSIEIPAPRSRTLSSSSASGHSPIPNDVSAEPSPLSPRSPRSPRLPRSPRFANTCRKGRDRPRESSSDWEMHDIYSDDALEDDEETGLTEADRSKRRDRKRTNAQLDERIAPQSSSAATSSAEAKQLAYKTLVRESSINVVLIILWYAFSIGISVFNKFVLGKDKLDFHFPLFFTCFHMIIQFALASLVMYFLPHLRPGGASPSGGNYEQIAEQDESARAQARAEKPAMTRFFYLTRIGPCGAATGLDIGLGNMSLKFITLTFYTMCKSSVLGFVLLFAFLFRLEKPSWRLAAIILTMAVGVIMMVAGESAFSALGFILIMSSAFFSGFRWSLTQILLIRNPATSNPFSSIFFLAPVMFLTLLVIALPVEGPRDFALGFQALVQTQGAPKAVAILLFPGLLAFSMTAAEFALLKRTSVVTLSVCGIFKEVLTILAASSAFGDQLTAINFSGLLVTIASIATYNYIKLRGMQADAKKDAREQVERRASIARRSTDGGAPASPLALQKAAEDEAAPRRSAALGRASVSAAREGGGDGRKPRSSTLDRASPPKRPEDLD